MSLRHRILVIFGALAFAAVPGIVAAAPGLGFVGLRYQYRIGSSLIGGVREDAEYVVRQLASHDAHAGRASAATHPNMKDL